MLRVILFLLLFLVPGWGQEVYQNREEGYSLEVPSGWEKSVAPGKVSIIAPSSEPLGSFDIVVELSEGLDLQEFVQRYLQIAGTDGAKTLSQKDVKLSGHPAVALVLLYPIRGVEVRMEVTVFLLEERAVTLTAMAVDSDFDNHRPTFRALLESFKLED